ncbi:MAG: hypothetical protein AB8B96_01720 [Lysobacterales bacterium]
MTDKHQKIMGDQVPDGRKPNIAATQFLVLDMGVLGFGQSGRRSGPSVEFADELGLTP